MRKLLIVSPRFPPRNTPDMHRVRTSLAYYEKFGWQPTVLALTPESSDGVEDTLLCKTLPSDIEIHHVKAWDEEKCRRYGFGHIDYRCLLPIHEAGKRLLAERRYNAVFFSTTAFLTFMLAPLWKRKSHTKIIFDFQDPWFEGSYNYRAGEAPGNVFKYRLSKFIARHGEAFAMKAADHVICVSPQYADRLSSAYPWLDRAEFSIIPFGTELKDRMLAGSNPLFRPQDGKIRWVYTGRVGPDMHPALDAFFSELAKWLARAPEFAHRLEVHFVGTNYSPSARSFKVVEPIALAYGVSSVVREHAERMPYSSCVSAQRQADAILLFGSEVKDYNASKLYGCLAMGKPVLAIFHRESAMAAPVGKFPNCHFVPFDGREVDEAARRAIGEGFSWLLRNQKFNAGEIDALLESHTAEAMTRLQCAAFDRAMARGVCVQT